MKKPIIKPLIILAALTFVSAFFFFRPRTALMPELPRPAQAPSDENIQSSPVEENPLSIDSLQERNYPSGDFTIEETLADGANYRQYIASYQSEGLKIYGLLTVPRQGKPQNGWPAIVFVHGYIPPDQYSTTGSYPSYQATLARSGFITWKPDLRGHGRSEGEPVSAHTSEKYVVDTMNAIAYLKNFKEVDPARIGYWGHSNGGEIGLRVVEISPDVKAAVFWAGVVGSHQDMLETYNEKIPFLKNRDDNPLVKAHGLPSQKSDFWKMIDPYSYLADIQAPIELHHGTTDKSVPIELSRHLRDALIEAGKEASLFEYPDDDHNISGNSGLAWQRSIDFFRKNL